MLTLRSLNTFRTNSSFLKHVEKEEEDTKITYRTKCIFKIENSRKKEECTVKNIYDKFGDIYIFEKFNKILVSTIRIVNFQMKKETFNKGKIKVEVPFNKTSIPDIKFWFNRYYYFSKYDEGIQMDYEKGWYSVTPEELAKYTALICKNLIVVDAFAGCGGNVIQFSKYCKKVYAIDIDKKKLEICENNTKIYNCSKNIEFIHSDFLKMENKIKVYILLIKADYIFLSPPWGGVEYKDSETYSIKEMMKPSIFDIIRVCLSIAKNIIFYLPRTILLDEFYEILSTCLNKEFDIIYTDIHILNSANKIKAIMLVFGQDINKLPLKDINKYIKNKYNCNDDTNYCNLNNIIKTIGISKFLKSESLFNKTFNLNTNKTIEELVTYLKDKILSVSDLNKIRMLESLENFDRNKGRKFPIQIFEDGKNCFDEEFKRSR